MKQTSIPRFTVSLTPDLSNDLQSICALLGRSKDDIIAEALEDWIECVAPIRLEDALNSQNEKGVNGMRQIKR